MVDSLIDDIDDETMRRIEHTTGLHGLSTEEWARETIIALPENREPNFARLHPLSTINEPAARS